MIMAATFHLDGDIPAPADNPPPLPLHAEEEPDVQRLALTGYDSDHARHIVLTIRSASTARGFIDRMLRKDLITFGEHGQRPDVAVNIGFTYLGLKALGLPTLHLETLATKSPAFAAGAPVRGGLRLGDSDEGAAEHWEQAFALDRAHVWLSLHADTPEALDCAAGQLRHAMRGEDCFAGWETGLDSAHLTRKSAPGAKAPPRFVHFGFRDNLAQPAVVGRDDKPDLHSAGELLLGYLNDRQFNFWEGKGTPDAVARFARNASFGVLRKIEQHEGRFDAWLDNAKGVPDAPQRGEYLKAKLCGRWPNGALVKPGELSAPEKGPGEQGPFEMLETKNDPAGIGCPFGAHIRRANPRNDPIVPPGGRTLFRRGMPYGPKFGSTPEGDAASRGLMGVFFCASIEDQFEGLVAEWIEKKPMGLDNRGRAKDPLVGHHEDKGAVFEIPLPDGTRAQVEGFEPFVTTRGTLYALFPGRRTLAELAAGADLAAAAQAAAVAVAPSPAPAPAPAPTAPVQPAAVDAGGAPSNRFCDIVMEGGITSGIIYTTAVAELSKHYRFRSIGGSSIGAFAAALTAAAELRRRKGDAGGFELLTELPAQLAAGTQGDARTQLERLFNPQPGTRRLFQIFLAALNRGTGRARAAAGVVEAVRQYGRWFGIVYWLPAIVFVLGCVASTIASRETASLGKAVLLALSFGGPWWLLALLVLALTLCGVVLAGVAWDVARGFVPNGFGLCRGHGGDIPAGQIDLVEFMHGAIQEAAGLDPKKGDPVTFGTLWAAPSSPSEMLQYAATGDDRRSIDLQVYVSNLAQGRPYRFPLDANDDRERLFFLASELQDYFPEGLMDALVGLSVSYSPGPGDPPLGSVPAGLRMLPVDNLPIVVAARLAMSFPFLISAVPLWALVYETPTTRPGARRCWMSDGGLCSNFPIHLFDCWLPRWPTFGISLQSRADAAAGPAVWLPQQYREGRDDAWVGDPKPSRGALASLMAFASSLFVTTWRWNDSTTTRMPGVRDRVARVYLLPGEGGVNIRMTGQQIGDLATVYGRGVADAFIARFARTGSVGWMEHRWTRLNTLLVALRERATGLAGAAGVQPGASALAQQIAQAASTPPLSAPASGTPWPSEGTLDASQVQDLEGLLAGLFDLEGSFGRATAPPPFNAVPTPSLRIRPST